MTSTIIGTAIVPMIVSLISRASIFLPRNSGVRPTIRPEMKTPRMTNSSIEYRPEPTPPQITSPVIICAIGTAPPRPLSDSIAALTAPQDAAVVTATNSALEPMPKRCSLPSRLSPVSPAACIAGVGPVSLM